MCRMLADFMVLDLGGVLHIFFGIPRDVPARFFSLRSPGGFLVTAEKRGALPDYLLVHPTAAATLRLANPWPDATVTDLLNDMVIATSRDPVLSVELVRGRDYLIAPAGFRLGECPVVDFACPEALTEGGRGTPS
jgi:hypothetical protein